MNEIKENEDDSIISVSFNQDNSCFSIGTENGFKIFQTYPFKGPYERIMNGGIGTVEMLYKSNFLALLGGGNSPKFHNNKVVIWDDYEKKVISELKFITPIINIKLKLDLIFVICQKRIFIFDFNSYDMIEAIDTCDNKRGLIAINSDPDFTVIAFPSLNKTCGIKNFKTKYKKTFSVNDNISYMTINKEGKVLATANDKGTLIRIHSCIDGTILKEFKRGMDKVDYIYICFDNETKFMAVSSNKGTIHIFSMVATMKKLKEIEKLKEKKENLNKKDIEKVKENDINSINKKKEKDKNDEKEDKKEDQKEENVKEEEKKEEKEEVGKINETKSVKNDNKNMTSINENKINELPENIKTFFGSEKSFAKFRIKSQIKNICTFFGNNLLIVITYDNKYYKAEININKGGSCTLLEENDLKKKLSNYCGDESD